MIFISGIFECFLSLLKIMCGVLVDKVIKFVLLVFKLLIVIIK